MQSELTDVSQLPSGLNIRNETAGLRTSIDAASLLVRAEVRSEIASARAEIFKWFLTLMAASTVIQIGVMIALAALLK